MSLIGTDVGRNAVQHEEVSENIDNVGGFELAGNPDRQAFARELINHAQHAERAPVMGAVRDEVIGPHVIGALRPKPHARSVIEPQTAPFRLPLRDL